MKKKVPGNGWYDSWKIGRVRFNRVQIFRRRPGGVFMIRFKFEGESVERSLRTCNEAKARRMALETSENIREAKKRRKRKTHAKRSEILAILADLRRVAEMAGAPEGHGPPVRLYDTEGRFTITKVRAAFAGYWYDRDTGGVNPKDQWSEALERFGLTPFHKHYHADTAQVAADVRRVARELGNPNRLPTKGEYAERGEWAPGTVMRHLEAGGWTEVGDALCLSMEAWRRDKAASMEGNTLSQSEAA